MRNRAKFLITCSILGILMSQATSLALLFSSPKEKIYGVANELGMIERDTTFCNSQIRQAKLKFNFFNGESLKYIRSFSFVMATSVASAREALWTTQNFDLQALTPWRDHDIFYKQFRDSFPASSRYRYIFSLNQNLKNSTSICVHVLAVTQK